MSKEDKKSSPSPNHGLLFDPSHLLGVHSLAASGFPFPHLAHLPNPYSLLGQPPGFPGLFGGLGGIPNPLHAAALSHSLAAGGSEWWRIASDPLSLSAPLPPSSSVAAASSTTASSSSTAASTSCGNTPSTVVISELDLPAHNPIGLSFVVGGLLTPATLGPITSVDSAKTSIGLLLASPLELAKPTSYYGLPKHPGEMGSPPPPSPSPSPSSHKRGRSSRSSTSASSSHRQASRSTSSPSSSSPHPPASPYLPSWAMNGSSYPFGHTSPSVGEGKQTSSSSRRSKQSSKSDSREGSGKIAQAHQHSLSSSLLTIPSAHSSLDHKSSTDKSLPPEGFTFDPRAMITPYHMSPELAYLSQSLFLHRPDLGMPSPFLTASSAASAITTTASSTISSTTASMSLEPGQVVSSSNSMSSSKHLSSKSSSSLNLSTKVSEKSRSDKHDKRSKEKSDDSSHSKRKSNGIRNSVDETRVPVKELDYDEASDDRFLTDPSHPSHMLDGDRKKRIADQIRKRVGMQDNNMSELLSKHGIKHSDWLKSHLMGDSHTDRHHPEEQKAGSSKQLKRKENETPENDRRSRERELNDKIQLEAELLKQEEQLRNLQKRYSIGEESLSSILDESCESVVHSEQDESKVDNSSASENVDVGSQSGSDSEGSPAGKRTADGSTDEGSPNKKRCTQLDERELVIPLEHGWNRQTIINGMGRRGIVGEVLYFAPCGKKMKTIPDVMRYLERNPNSDLGRENFSFNTKVNVGHFYEVRGGQGSQPVPLSDAEVLEKIEMSRGKRARMQMLARQKREKAAREQALARQVMEVKLKRRIELQELSQRASEMRFEKKQERLRLKELEKKERENKVIERRKEKEQHKRDRQEEKMRVQEQLRREREMRAQQIIEARNRRQRELEEMRLADALQRNKERDMKRQQLVIMKEQERERRRQHLLLLKALEQRKRQEEKQSKERQREEKLNEKMKLKEIKMHQRRVEMEVALELKKPVEDMELKNAKPLPKYSRLKSKLAGRPIADCLMAVEFLNNFGIALNLDKSSIPTLESLEKGILNESEEDVEEFMSLVMHLLRFSLDDVGVPNPREAMTKLHQKITEMEMTDTTMSEVLRIFLKARGEKEMSEWLTIKPMEALNPTKKAAILAFLCNELLTSKVVTNEIDKHMDAINNLRRDKWVVEGQLRQLRVFQARKFNKIHKSTDRRTANNNNMNQDDDTMCSSKLGSEDEDDKDDDEDKEDDEGSESDGSSSVMTNVSSNFNMPFEPLDENLTRDESDKRIEKLRKQHAAFRQKVFRASLRLRAINMGQDRYKRTYWVLPLTGGVYVEGMESGVPEDYAKESQKGSHSATDAARPEINAVKAETQDDCETTVKDETRDAGLVGNAACDPVHKCAHSEDSATNCSERLEPAAKEIHMEVDGEQFNSKQDFIGSGPKQSPELAGVTHPCLDGDSATQTFSEKVRSSEILCEDDHKDSSESCGKAVDIATDSISKSLSVNHSVTTPLVESGPNFIACRNNKKSTESSFAKVTCSVSDEGKKSPSIGNGLVLNQLPEFDNVHRVNDTSLAQPSIQGKEMAAQITRKEAVEGAEGSLKLVNGSHTVVDTSQDFTTFRQVVSSVGSNIGHKALDEAQGLAYAEIDCDAKSLKSRVPGETNQKTDKHHSVSSLNLSIQTDNFSNGLEVSGPDKMPHSSLVSDILKVPKVGGQRETLVSLLNHSIHQAYQKEEHEEKHSKDMTNSKSTSLISSPSSSSSVVPSILTSSLLFSAIPKLPQPAHVKKDISVPLSCPSNPLIPLDFTQKQKYRMPVDGPLFNTAPIPAHTKPINPQPLPPFHPSAQASPLLDLAPPAAHSGHKTNKSTVPPPHAISPAPPPHLPQPPYIPGLSHYPYGPSSASETLSSLASIISPPPAHHNPTTTSAISAPLLTSTPLQPRSTPTSSKTRSSYPKVDSILKGESPYSSSELLQQAASQVLRSAENQKLSPPISSTSSTPQSSRLSASLLTQTDDVSAYNSPEFISENGNKSNSEVVDHKLWFSILPRMPCDEYSLTQPIAGQGPSSHSYQLSSLSASSSLSALSSYLNSPTAANLDALLPLIQSNSSLLSQDPLFTSLQLLTSQATPSVSPTPCSTPGLDSAGEFKVPPPPDMNPHCDPWEILRAAQGEAQVIPRNEQHGWWRIFDIAILKSVMPCTLNRGIREKNLQRAIHRYLDYARLHCTYDSEKGETNPDLTECQPANEDKTVANTNLKENKEECMDMEVDKNSSDTLQSNDTSQSNGKDTVGIADKDLNETEPAQLDAVVKEEIKDEMTGGDAREQKDQKPNCDSESDDFVAPDNPDAWSVKCLHQIELAALDEVEALEERIFQASLQAKQGWRPHKDANLQLVDRSVTEVSDTESYPLDVAISRLLELEANIERRYLKPPLIRSVQLNLSSLSSHSDRTDGDFGDDETIPPGLLLWRQAVVSSESPAQLSLCTQMLAKSISWEKSIMRVTCQICRKDDNEAELLLCDGCDKGYHTYCFKPKMDNIPDGDWYCYECVSKASGTPHCVVCGIPGGRIVSCSKCPRYIHLECLDPPLPRMPKRWQCSNCMAEKGNPKRSKKKKEALPTVQRINVTKLVLKEEPLDADDLTAAPSTSGAALACGLINNAAGERTCKKGSSKSDVSLSSGGNESPRQSGSEKKKRKKKEKDIDPMASPPKKKEKKEKKEKKPKEKKSEDGDKTSDAEDKKGNNKDLLGCGKLLTELEKHEDGWPFLKPVNKKQFPSYKKYIKSPMDFNTARSKLKSKEYKHRQEFAADMRLIFNNCETFNEDDSDVGQAGFNLRQYFERRWLDMFPDDAP